MNYFHELGKKINRIRKKNWSAPTIMGVFIIICMIIIYSFESLGLFNKERNLDYRISTPEKIIKVISNDLNSKTSFSNEQNNSEKGNNLFDDKKFKIYTAKNKEEHLMEIKSILLEGAKNQFSYENNIGQDDYLNYHNLFSFYDL